MFDSSSIEVLLSTMDCVVPPANVASEMNLSEHCDLLIINQSTQAREDTDGRLRIQTKDERGLSRSRNRALESAHGDICVFADNDVQCTPDLIRHLQAAFRAYPDAAAITFQYLDSTTRRPAKDYPPHSRRHTRVSVAGVSSIEIAVRRELIGDFRFDEKFGLGTPIPMGEENIFLTDLLHAGLPVYYWPAPLFTHQGAGAGYGTWTAKTGYYKGAVLRRMYSTTWPAFVVGLAIAKHRHYKSEVSLTSWLRSAVRGALGKGPKPNS
jgi:glycosyltransferase involved in cell wall biosynthesis